MMYKRYNVRVVSAAAWLYLGSQLQGCTLREHVLGSLRHAVGAHVGRTALGANGGDIHDATPGGLKIGDGCSGQADD